MNAGAGSRDSNGVVKQAAIEFCDAWFKGEKPDLDAFCHRYPAYESELRVYIEKILSVDDSFKKCREKEKRALSPTRSKEESLNAKILGDFHLLREIGRGGMGVVYEAEQVSLGRTVAIKVLPAHLTLRPETVSRFKREAATAAKLKHPGIVEIYTVGEAEGNHFFAMELVEGAPCDKIIERLSRERISFHDGRMIGDAVMRTICYRSDASESKADEPSDRSDLHDFWKKSYVETVCRIVVQMADALDHAHKAGVIHRDVKPSNILVRADGTCVLTDFGLAREEGLPSLTVTGQLAGTPHYIAPEQAAARSGTVDLRVDIYSLGVTLYEMLTLTRPFEGRTTQDVLAKIASKEPSAPRGTNPLIPKDLEILCLTAMEKDPTRRYQSAEEFKDDLLRFLEFRPIKAQPASMGTRIIRMIRRNPAYSVIFSLLFLLIVVGPLLFGIQQKLSNIRIEKAFKLAAKERDAKEIALKQTELERDAKVVALERAESEATTAQQVSDFLADVFQGSDPFLSLGKTMTAYDLLQRGSVSITKELMDQRDVQTRLMSIIGESYKSLGYYDEAEPHLRESLELFRSELGETHPSTISAYYTLADLHLLQERVPEASRLLNTALAHIHTINEGKYTPEQQNLELKIRVTLGHIHSLEGNDAKAERVFRRIIDEASNSSQGEYDLSPIREAIHHLSQICIRTNRLDEAEALLEKCLEPCSGRFDPRDHPILRFNVMGSLAQIYFSRGDYYKTESSLQETYHWCLDVLGKNHHLTHLQSYYLAFLYLAMGRLEEAQAYGMSAFEGLSKILDPNSLSVLQSMFILSLVYIQQGRFEEAESFLVDAFERSRNAAGSKQKDSFGSYVQNSLLTDKSFQSQIINPFFMESNASIGYVSDESNTIASIITQELADLYAMQGRYE
ncbi:MAG: serine/threonine-protein kinase, partial [Planctomycetota bacterium]